MTRAQRPRSRSAFQTLASGAAGGLRALAAGGPHLWLTVAMIVVGGLLHYTSPLPCTDEASPWHLTRHAMDRILLMVPVIYAGFIFGPRGGFATLFAVTLIMLPRAISSANVPDSLLEVSSVVLVSSLVLLWFREQHKEKERRQVILMRLEMARQELASQVEIIKKDERRLAAINEVCGVVAQSLDLPDILQRILDQVVDEIGVTAAMIFLKDKSGQKLELVAHKGISKRLARALSALKVGDGLNSIVAETGDPMVVENASDDSRLSIPEVKEERLQSEMIVPLRSKGLTTGTLCVATRGSRRFTADDKDLLTAIGSQVGIAIENARLYQEVLASEEKYRDLFENATVSIFVQDLDGVITDANKACATLTGYPLSHLIGLNVKQLFGPEALEILTAKQQALLQGEAANEPYDVRLLRSEGVEPILSMTTRLVTDDGQPTCFQHIARDVTERRRMRDTLNYYLQQVLTAQEEERKRIARELHDETAQSLLLILQKMDGLTYSSGRWLAGMAETYVEELRAVVLQTLGNLRRLTRDLRPQILDDLGLVAAVEWLAEDVERQCGIKTTVEVSGTRSQLTPEAQLLLFRIVQEALSNVRRHSGASAARITLEFADGKAMVTVEDNGHGFELPDSLGDLADTGKLGLLGMSERARLAGGSITIRSKPGEGTRVTAEFN